MKRCKGLVNDVGRKADINIRTSKAGTKHDLDFERVTEGATSLIDELPPSISKTAAKIAAASKVREQADEIYKKHEIKLNLKNK